MAGKQKRKDTVKAPRSLGCRTCVKQRIKCDELKPVCSRCALAGLGCDGAKTVDDFQIHTQEEMQRMTISKAQIRDENSPHDTPFWFGANVG